jgi:hypothetical protein
MSIETHGGNERFMCDKGTTESLRRANLAGKLTAALSLAFGITYLCKVEKRTVICNRTTNDVVEQSSFPKPELDGISSFSDG